MKAKLRKLLKGFSAHYISTIEEPIVGLLPCIEKQEKYLPLTEFAMEQGYVTMRPCGQYNQYFFTEKGLKEFRAEYCVSGQKIG